MSGYEVASSVRRYRGSVIGVRTDTVRMPGGAVADRDVVEHPGAVGVVALDDAGRVLLLRQYRHPLGRHLWELPAGLRDVPDERPVDAARRELREETGWSAARWDLLAEADSSPGMTDEHVLVFLARELTPGEPDAGEHEESELPLRWVDLDAACAEALAGDITNAMCVLGVLAAARSRDLGWTGLRDA